MSTPIATATTSNASTVSPSPGQERVFQERRKKKKSGFRKAPGAPKRFKSSYIFFSIAKMKEIREKSEEKEKVGSVAKQVSDAWHKISPEERAKWDDIAQKDKLRYTAEKETYTGPWKVPIKRAKKDPCAPKRPMSAFLHFSQVMRPKVKEQKSHLRNTEISKILGDMWKAASEEERRPHVEKEAKDRAQYKLDIVKWRTEKAEEEKNRRDQAEATRRYEPTLAAAMAPPQHMQYVNWPMTMHSGMMLPMHMPPDTMMPHYGRILTNMAVSSSQSPCYSSQSPVPFVSMDTTRNINQEQNTGYIQPSAYQYGLSTFGMPSDPGSIPSLSVVHTQQQQQFSEVTQNKEPGVSII